MSGYVTQSVCLFDLLHDEWCSTSTGAGFVFNRVMGPGLFFMLFTVMFAAVSCLNKIVSCVR